MNSPVYRTFFVCLVYFSQASSNPLRPTDVETLNEALLDLSDEAFRGYLLYSIPAASSGKNFFEIPYDLSEDCIRTAKAIMQSYAKPSIATRTLTVIHRSYTKAARAKYNTFFHILVNMTCHYLNDEVSKYPSDFPDFEQLKSDVQLPNPPKNYIYQVPSDRNNITAWLHRVPMNIEDPEMFRFETILQFQKFRTSKSDVSHLNYMAIAKSVDQLSKRAASKSTVDRLFAKALDDFTSIVLPLNVDKYKAAHTTAFAKLVDIYFAKNQLLKYEYQKIKQQVKYEE